MFQADATIAWVDGNGIAQAQDYYLSNYVQVCGLKLQLWYNVCTQIVIGNIFLFQICAYIVSWWNRGVSRYTRHYNW